MAVTASQADYLLQHFLNDQFVTALYLTEIKKPTGTNMQKESQYSRIKKKNSFFWLYNYNINLYTKQFSSPTFVNGRQHHGLIRHEISLLPLAAIRAKVQLKIGRKFTLMSLVSKDENPLKKWTRRFYVSKMQTTGLVNG